MKRDNAKVLAVNHALTDSQRVLHGADMWPFLAPSFDLGSKTASQREFVGPPEKGIPMRERERFEQNRNFFAAKASRGMYTGADHAEWASIPVPWRVIMMMAGGMGDIDTIDYLAGRSWQEIPPKEREAVKFTIREAKRLFSGLHALTLRTVE